MTEMHFWRQIFAAARPNLETELARFRTARDAAQAGGRLLTVAVVGLGPAQGRSTVAALMALAAAGYTDRRVVVIDAARDRGTTGRARRPTTVTSLLGGRAGTENLDLLLAVPPGLPIARHRLRAAATTGAAVTVLGLPAGDSGSFAPQILDQAIARLRHRTDLLIIDTPSGPREPVLHSVMHVADHLIVAVRAGRDAAAQVRAAQEWITSTPGLPRERRVSVVVVPGASRLARWARWHSRGLEGVRLPWDPALRARRLTGLRRGSVIGALQAVALVQNPRSVDPVFRPAVLPLA